MSQGYIRKLESFNLTCSIYLDVLFLLLLVTGIILISYMSRGKKLKKKKKELAAVWWYKNIKGTFKVKQNKTKQHELEHDIPSHSLLLIHNDDDGEIRSFCLWKTDQIHRYHRF